MKVPKKQFPKQTKIVPETKDLFPKTKMVPKTKNRSPNKNIAHKYIVPKTSYQHKNIVHKNK